VPRTSGPFSRWSNNAQEIPGVLEILLQPAVEGTLHSGANPARQVDIRCRDNDRFVFLFDADNAIEWMLSFFGVLLAARKADNLVHVVPSKNAMQFPPPAPPMVDGTALRTESALVQLFSFLVRIEDRILLSVSAMRRAAVRRCGSRFVCVTSHSVQKLMPT
jgi:hypothetical protein